MFQRRIWREGVWIGAGQAAVALAGFAALKLLTSLLSVEDYGRFALLAGLVALGSSVLIGPILQAVLKFYPEAASRGAVRAFRGLAFDRMLRSALLLAGVFAAAGAVWAWSTTSPARPLAFVLAALFLAADAIRGLETSLLNAARLQRDAAVRGAVDAWLRPALAGVAIALIGPGVAPVFAGYFVGSLATTLALRRRVVAGEPGSSGGWAADPWLRERHGAFVRFVLPLIPLAVLNWVMSLGDRYVLAGITGAAAVGTYAAAYALGSQPVIAANQLISTTLRPVLYDAVATADGVKERRVLRVWLGLTVALAASATAISALLAPALTRGLLGASFGGAAELLPWITLAYGFQAVQQSFEIMLYAHGQTRRLMFLQAIAAVAALCFYLVLIPRYGAMGAAWGTLATFLVTTASAAIMAAAPRRLLGKAA